MPEKGKDKQSYAIIGAAMAVYNELGHGFLETVYQEALEKEFQLLSIPYQREHKIDVCYKGYSLKSYYVADFICFNSIIVELKAISDITNNDHAQVINYLKATSIQRGLLLNFGSPSLQYKRLILTPNLF